MTEQMTWNLPPIHFVKDDSSRQIWQVEELLKVADMGPDFQPTPFVSTLKSQPGPARELLERNSEDRYYQTDEDSLRAVAGPGGSMELVMSKSDDQQQTSTEQDKDSLPFDTAAELKSDSEKTACDEAVSVGDEMTTVHDSVMNDFNRRRTAKSFEDVGSDDAKLGSEIRSDICGLDHGKLWQQVLNAKRKSADRSYRLSDEFLARYSAVSRSASKLGSTRDLITRSTMKKRKSGRAVRHSDYYLSCHYHNVKDD